MNKKIWVAYVIKAVLMLALLAEFIKWTNLVDSVLRVPDIPLVFLMLAAITVIVVNAAKMYRFWLFAKGLGLRIGVKEFIIAHSIAPIIGRITPAKLGEGIKIMLLKADKKKLGF